MNNKLYSYFIILCMCGIVSADCRSNWNACVNITLPFDTYTDVVGGKYYRYNFDDVMTKDGVKILNDGLTNIHFRVVNTTTSGNPTYNVKGLYMPLGTTKARILMQPNQSKSMAANNDPSYMYLCTNMTYNNGITPGNIIYTGSTDFKTIKDTDMTYFYYRNWTFRDETTNQLFSFAGQNATLIMWCDDYTEVSYNLSATTTASNMKIMALQEPKFFATINGATARIRQDSVNMLTDNYYVASTNPVGFSPYTFTLQDFTGGQFWGSTLQIQRNINDTLGFVHVERFPVDSVVTANLENNTQYRFKVVGDTSTRDLGGIYIQDTNTIRNIVVTRPDMSQYLNKWRGLTISLTQDYDSSQVGCVMNSTSVETFNFTVYNITSNDYVYDYKAADTGSNIVATYTVTDNNGSYYVCCSAYNSVEGQRNKCQVINIRDLDAIQYGFDLNLPDRVLGISRATVYKLVSIAILVIVAGIFSQQSYGTGSLVTAACLSFFYYIGWFPIPQIMVGFIWTLAIFTKISENRQGVAT